MVECESFYEDDILCLFRNECEERKVFVEFRLGEAHQFLLSPGIVVFLYNVFEYVEGVLMSECLSFDVKAWIAGLSC